MLLLLMVEQAYGIYFGLTSIWCIYFVQQMLQMAIRLRAHVPVHSKVVELVNAGTHMFAMEFGAVQMEPAEGA